MNVEFDIGSDQSDGARDYQEDAFMISQLGETPAGKTSALMIMADGMGGHAAGNVASNMVVATFNKAFQSVFPPKNPAIALKQSLLSANEQIAASVAETPALSGMGCTMVTAYLEGNELWWVSVGDSHLYLIRDKELIKQNADHSYGAFLDMMIEQGEEIDEDSGMSRNMLMSAMTGTEISSIDCPESPIKLQPGDRIIIASDGLDTIGAGAIIQYSSWSKTAKECVYALLKAVDDVKRKNQDNTTIIVADIIEKEEKAAASSTLSTQEAEPNQRNSRLTDQYIADDKPPSNILRSLIILIILSGAGYYAWTLGFIDQALSKASEFITKDVESSPTELTIKPAPAPEPVIVEETPKPVAPVYKAPRKPPVIKKQAATQLGSTFQDQLKNGTKAPQMIELPSGTFRMGGASSFISADEAPRHEVNIKKFAISTHEITFAEYEVFAKATKRSMPNHNNWDKTKHAVINVSWDDALAYVQWLSQQTGHKYRLPSEAEWEYAARAGTSTPFWWGNEKGINNAQCFDCQSDFNQSKPAKVGSFKANPFGLYDTAGNVFEWTHDCYHSNYVNAPTDGSVWEGGNCSVRVARGGAYRSPASSMRAANREKFPSNKGQYHVGIRIVRAL